MKSWGTTILVLAVLTLALPASANSTDGSYSATVSGVKSTGVQGNFVFNTATDTFIGTLAFSGVFSGITGPFKQPKRPPASVPEGGSAFLYLGLAAFVMFTAFFVARSRTSPDKSASTP